MTKKKKTSKKTRFNVFKRDGFQCQYCGRNPPAVTLECDHIKPVSKGGDNDIDNLITSCFDCNRGKSDALLSAIPDSIQKKKAIIEEKELQLKGYYQLIKRKNNRISRDIKRVEDIFQQYFTDREFTETFRSSIKVNFISKLSINDIEDAMHMACARVDDSASAIKYFCGICWNWIKEGVDHG